MSDEVMRLATEGMFALIIGMLIWMAIDLRDR